MAGEAADIVERSAIEVSDMLASGAATSEALVEAYAARIEAIDKAGPRLNSVISLSPWAAIEARARDAERRAGALRGPLHGVPVLVKDNIDVADGAPTTAGSLALLENRASDDAPVVHRLREAGCVVLGKTNLSEWANIRSTGSISGWSAVGGLTRNPYALDRSAGGSSSGSGAAAAASLCAAAVGTETDGSIVCPASLSGLVGLKPTVGLVSRRRIIPISASQDTAGPMTRTVADAALMLTAMAGSDPGDAATAEADAHRTDYLAALKDATLRGRRIGVLTWAAGLAANVDAVFEEALALLRAEGAEVVEAGPFAPSESLGEAERLVLLTELKAGLASYLADAPPEVGARSLADLIAFNQETQRELCLFGQELFEHAQTLGGLDDPAYRAARASSLREAGTEGLDRLIAAQRLDALVAPSFGPAWRIDVVAGARGAGRASQLPAIAGYPHLTVPMGFARGLPLGLSLIGPAWSEGRLLGLGFAFERARGARRPPAFSPSVESGASFEAAFAPYSGPAAATPRD